MEKFRFYLFLDDFSVLPIFNGQSFYCFHFRYGSINKKYQLAPNILIGGSTWISTQGH